MKDLVEYIVKSIVAEPDAVKITEENSDTGLLIKLEVMRLKSLLLIFIKAK